MKRQINILVTIILLLWPIVNFGQVPDLGSAANFVLFSTNGPISATSINYLTGNIGTNNGGSSGFTNVNGTLHDMDAASAQCAIDLLSAYNQLDTITATAILTPILGNGDTLIAGVFKILSAASLNLNLTLNAQGNTNAVFIFQIQGAFSTNALSKVKLINGAKTCNVFWKVEGLVSMGVGTTMRGTIIANNAAINIYAGDTLEGRALSTTGAVGIDNITAFTPIGCGNALPSGPIAPILGAIACFGLFSSIGTVTNNGTSNFSGDVGTNSGIPSGFNGSIVSGVVHNIPDSTTAAAATAVASVYAYLNSLSYDIDLMSPTLLGHNLVLTPHTYRLNAATILTDTLYLDAESDANAVFVIQVNGAFSTSINSQVILINGAQSKNVYWKIEGPLTMDNNSKFNGTIVCNNGAIILNIGVIINGRVLTTKGTITTTSVSITANRLPDAGIITGVSSLFVGTYITLSDAHSGGIWSCSNAKAVVSGSTVTGVSSGLDTIRYIVTNLCGTDTASKIITIEVAPTVCVGATLTLNDAVSNGIWSSSNSSASISEGVITGLIAGIDTIMYSVFTICGTDIARLTITVNTLPYAGNITGTTSLCKGSFTILTDQASGGTWSSTITTDIISGGVVFAKTCGIDTIRYIVSNICGMDTAMITLNINPVPPVPLITTLATLPICTGTLYQNFSTALPPPTNVVYIWSAINATVWATSNNKQNIIVSFPNSGNTTIILSAILSNSLCESADTFIVDVESSETEICKIFYFEKHFVCLPSNLESYQWGYDDVTTLAPTILKGEINQDYFNAFPDYENKYYWVNTAYRGCNQKTYYNAPVAIQNANFNDKIVIDIYPNPATELLNVSIKNVIYNTLQLDIVNIAGQKFSTIHTSNNQFSLDISKLNAGFYMVNCYTEGKKIGFAKFIKE